MSDCKNGRLPATRRQRHRLGFTGTAQPQLAQQRPVANQDRVNYIQPATEIRPERNIFRRVQLEQSAPVNTSVVNSKKETKPKSFIAVPPSHAVAYPNHKTADFFPWAPDPEKDAVTEHQARNGHFDKLPAAAAKNEMGSARPALHPILKQKNGLPTLSALFLSVLEKRNEMSNITAPSTFKPPPRVSLVDTRRESWLEDLANPAVPLRRLSRTIPHGIRGKALLDQCMLKNVPLNRAVWFVRCVGANELRGLKRKGAGPLAGGELRWVREWTGQVASFVESNLTEINRGEPVEAIRKRINYALRLAGHLYMERLLDSNAFLEHYLQFLNRGGFDKLPAALLMVGSLQREIFSDRIYGRKFYESLLSLAKQIVDLPYRHIYAPLFRKLSMLLRTHLISNLDALIIPKSWETVRSSLLFSIDWWMPHCKACIRNVEERNRALHSRTLSDSNMNDLSTELLRILDNALFPFDPKAILQSCRKTCPDDRVLVRILCQWAITPFREGVYRIYVVCALLQAAADEIDVQELLMGFLEDRMLKSSQSRMGRFFHLMSELTRLGIFSVARLMKWAIVRGALMSTDPESPFARLLSELPVCDLPADVRNLRSSLLSPAGYQAHAEQWMVSTAAEVLSRKLEDLSIGDSGSPGSESLEATENDFFCSLSRSVMVEVASWIKATVQAVLEKTVVNVNTGWAPGPADSVNSIAATDKLALAVKVLEIFDDVRTMSQIVIASSCSSDEGVLCFAAELTKSHFVAFSALGESTQCLTVLYQKYCLMKAAEGKFPYRLCRALFELASYPGQEQSILSQLNFDMYHFIQSVPVSGLDEALHNQGPFHADGALNQRYVEVFRSVSGAIEHASDAEQQDRFFALYKLRQMDGVAYTRFMKEWVLKLLTGSREQHVAERITRLVAWSCVELAMIASVAIETAKSGGNASESNVIPDVLLCALALALGDSSSINLDYPTCASLRSKSDLFVLRNGCDFVLLLSSTLRYALSSGQTIHSDRLLSLLSSPHLKGALKTICARELQLVVDHLVAPVIAWHDERVLGCLTCLLNLLIHDEEITLSNGEPRNLTMEFCRLLQSADILCIPLAELKLKLLCESITSLPDGARLISSITHSIDRDQLAAIFKAFPEKCSALSALLVRLDDDCKRKVHWFVEQLVLQSDSNTNLPAVCSELDLKGNGSFAICQFILCLLQDSAPAKPTLSTPEALEKINRVIIHLSSGRPQAPGFPTSAIWIRSLLSLLVTYSQSLSKDTVPANEIASIILSFLSFLPSLETYSEDTYLIDSIYDVLSILIDVCPNPAFYSLRNYLKDKSLTPRTYSLFFNRSGNDRWLRATNPVQSPSKTVGGGLLGSASSAGFDTPAREFPIKAWEKLAEPSPNPGENDVCISLQLFSARKVRCT